MLVVGLGEPDPSAARQALINSAKAGDADAQCRMGDLCRTGDEYTKQDHAEALRWYKVAAEQGDADAQNNLGAMHQHGMGTVVDPATAAKWYQLAADQNHATAQFNLAMLYLAGNGVARDEREAARWLQNAAMRGYVEAQAELGTLYRYGRGVGQSFAYAAELHLEAAEAGDAGSAGSLADYLDELEAVALAGNMTAAHCLAKMYENGVGVPKDNARLYAWVRWGLRKGRSTLDDDGARGNFDAWLYLLKRHLRPPEQRRGLREFNKLKAAHDALRRDRKRPAA